jgi:hypothetical protein
MGAKNCTKKKNKSAGHTGLAVQHKTHVPELMEENTGQKYRSSCSGSSKQKLKVLCSLHPPLSNLKLLNFGNYLAKVSFLLIEHPSISLTPYVREGTYMMRLRNPSLSTAKLSADSVHH